MRQILSESRRAAIVFHFHVTLVVVMMPMMMTFILDGGGVGGGGVGGGGDDGRLAVTWSLTPFCFPLSRSLIGETGASVVFSLGFVLFV